MGGVNRYFVYVNDSRHIWRYVYFARYATSGQHAIDMASAEARELGNDVSGVGYMAVPADAITTHCVPEAAEAS
jgi:hypothetical protein